MLRWDQPPRRGGSGAEELVAEFGYAMIPPYDAPEIVAGQGTCGLEIVEQLPDVDLIISPVSGGGLLSGTATAVKLAAQEGLASKECTGLGCGARAGGRCA